MKVSMSFLRVASRLRFISAWIDDRTESGELFGDPSLRLSQPRRLNTMNAGAMMWRIEGICNDTPGSDVNVVCLETSVRLEWLRIPQR